MRSRISFGAYKELRAKWAEEEKTMAENLPAVIDNTNADNAGQLMRRATDVAGACREIVMKSARKIGNRRYVQVEGWQSIANTFGCVAGSGDVEKVEGGIRAIGQVRRVTDGLVLCTAEGFVGDDEPMWAKRPEYARRAMAQTRAISRACRSAFAFVVTMIDSNLSTTPAEEMSDHGDTQDAEFTTKQEPDAAALSRAALVMAQAEYAAATTLPRLDEITKAHWKQLTKEDRETAKAAATAAASRIKSATNMDSEPSHPDPEELYLTIMQWVEMAKTPDEIAEARRKVKINAAILGSRARQLETMLAKQEGGKL